MAEPVVHCYPTGVEVIDQLSDFIAARLPTVLGPVPRAHHDRPSLAEDWWVETREDAGYAFPVHGLRACYRWARKQNIETGQIVHRSTEAAADLLLHQITELIPTLGIAAATNLADQQPDLGIPSPTLPDLGS